MAKIVITNLPVTTFVNAEVEVEDGPDHTVHQRILQAVLKGRWRRAGGKNEESYEDLDLTVDRGPLEYPLWSFDVLSPPLAPVVRRVSMTYGEMPERAAYDEAWDRAVLGEGRSRFSFGNDRRLGTCELSRDQLWEELQKAHEEYHFDEEIASSSFVQDAGDWCSAVLGTLGFEWV